MDKNKTIIRSTTVVCVRDNESVVIASDGQVTLGTSVIKSNANKIRTFHNDQIIVGFAGSTADALTLFDRLEKKCEEFSYNLDKLTINQKNKTFKLIQNGSNPNFILIDVNSEKKKLAFFLRKPSFLRKPWI